KSATLIMHVNESNNMKNELQGLWPAMFTPLDERGEPQSDQLEKLVQLLISQGLDGLYILGSTGQGVLLSEEQRKRITEIVVEVTAGRVPVMVQVGAMTTGESVRHARHAEQCGADAVSSVGPIYYAGSADMALAHYNSIATATALPFFPYQLSENTMSEGVELYVERLLEIPNIAGMKLTTNHLLEISTIHNFAGERLKLF